MANKLKEKGGYYIDMNAERKFRVCQDDGNEMSVHSSFEAAEKALDKLQKKSFKKITVIYGSSYNGINQRVMTSIGKTKGHYSQWAEWEPRLTTGNRGSSLRKWNEVWLPSAETTALLEKENDLKQQIDDLRTRRSELVDSLKLLQHLTLEKYYEIQGFKIDE